ncbi:hypothetical protein EJ02DRAFT_456745 [Clathrospora elynae]|uniref:Extracellular mutant protein 11 C-terminal domain-containing protein n=1 Tax=Clathrospora elynae TaxID=706981 RepID=A0A6A5SIW3_9PLEO|nr:hypothetical protein EJ02DRAFT_456745 [Clathrospora elynae]
MHTFIQNRGGLSGSPQNGQPQAKPERQAIAANARIPMKQAPGTHQPQAQSGTPARGIGNAQNSSAVMQHAPQRRQSGQGHGQKHDPYDTDAESLDTTVNQSFVQIEDSQQIDQQHGQIVDLGEGSDDDDEDVEDVEDVEDYVDFDDYVLTEDDNHLLQREGIQDLTRDEQLAFLQQARLQNFRTIEGDSYPTTTNGEPSDRGGGQEPSSEYHNDAGPVSPSPQRPTVNNQFEHSFAPQPLQREQISNMPGLNHNPQMSSTLFQQSANIRDQQRSTAPLTQRSGQGFQYNAAALSSQPPNYSQVNPDIAPALSLHANTHSGTHGHTSKPLQHGQRQSSGHRVQFQSNIINPIEPPVPSKRPSFARVKAEPVIRQHPVVQQQPIEQAPIEYVQAAPECDYDRDTLFGMRYADLKNEDFDTNPHAKSPVLAKSVLQQPLVERLEFVQKNLDPGQQSDFFRSMPTTEWEDAGDWFLDQFQSIIQHMKQARQSKRKLAQEFEEEVEKRHKHVSKKQQQVEEAMGKMKTQGEGLVPRSPRPSKSPRPKRG